MCSKLRLHDPRAPPSFRLGQQLCPGRAGGARLDDRVPVPRRVGRPARRRQHGRRRRHARLRQGQSGDRPDLRRRRRAGRRAEGDDRGVQAVRLRLDGEHPGLRAARRPVQGAGAEPLEVRRRVAGAGALRQERARAAEAVRRHDRQRARPSRATTRWCRRGGSAAISTSATSRPAPSLYLPVEVAGALFSVGDTHAAQGDGEVCGTAIESPMDVVLTLDLVKDARLKTPRFTTLGPGDAPSRRQGLRGDDRHRAGPDGGRQKRGRADGRPARRPLRHGPGRRLHALSRSAAISGSARSSTCRTGWCRSTSRAASSNDGSGSRRTVRGHGPGPRRRGQPGARRRRPHRLGARRGWRARGRLRPLLHAGARRDALHRRRIRLRQVDDRAGDHAAAAAARRAHFAGGRSASATSISPRLAKAGCGASAATASP